MILYKKTVLPKSCNWQLEMERSCRIVRLQITESGKSVQQNAEAMSLPVETFMSRSTADVCIVVHAVTKKEQRVIPVYSRHDSFESTWLEMLQTEALMYAGSNRTGPGLQEIPWAHRLAKCSHTSLLWQHNPESKRTFFTLFKIPKIVQVLGTRPFKKLKRFDEQNVALLKGKNLLVLSGEVSSDKKRTYEDWAELIIGDPDRKEGRKDFYFTTEWTISAEELHLKKEKKTSSKSMILAWNIWKGNRLIGFGNKCHHLKIQQLIFPQFNAWAPERLGRSVSWKLPFGSDLGCFLSFCANASATTKSWDFIRS